MGWNMRNEVGKSEVVQMVGYRGVTCIYIRTITAILGTQTTQKDIRKFSSTNWFCSLRIWRVSQKGKSIYSQDLALSALIVTHCQVWITNSINRNQKFDYLLWNNLCETVSLKLFRHSPYICWYVNTLISGKTVIVNDN